MSSIEEVNSAIEAAKSQGFTSVAINIPEANLTEIIERLKVNGYDVAVSKKTKQ